MSESVGAVASAATEFCLFGLSWCWACMTKAEWSGWVQAVGSVFAIGATGGAAVLQIRAARTERENGVREKIGATLDGLQGVARTLLAELESNTAAMLPSAQRWCDSSSHAFHEVYEAAKSIPIHDMPTRELVKIAFDVRHAAASAVHTRDKHIAGHRGVTLYYSGADPFDVEIKAVQLTIQGCEDLRKSLNLNFNTIK